MRHGLDIQSGLILMRLKRRPRTPGPRPAPNTIGYAHGVFADKVGIFAYLDSKAEVLRETSSGDTSAAHA